MTTKEKLLQLFESNKGTYFSGEDIARELKISRAAVWKAVSALRKEGYSIDAVNNRGYALAVDTDILSPQGVEKYLDAHCEGLQLQVLAETASTNALVREQANAGAGEGLTVIANAQSAGRGRGGHRFYSPGGTGAYLSLLLRPKSCPADRAVRLTAMAAAAMCQAIEEVCGETPGIKWINDIFLGGKKVCGILTEGSFGLESGMLDYAVLGVGLNVYEPAGGFPEELRDVAGALFPSPRNDMKNRLVAAFLNRFMAFYQSPEASDYLALYRARSLVIGRTVTVLSPAGECRAEVLGIDDSCRIRLRFADGSEKSCTGGECSIRL